MLGKALNAVEVVTFDYPCEFLSQLLCDLFNFSFLWVDLFLVVNLFGALVVLWLIFYK